MENSLFNDKTIQNLSENTPINPKQKKSAKIWLDLMDKGELKNEKKNYLKFYDIILRDLLGYDDIKFEENNVEFTYVRNGKRMIRIETKGMDTKDLFKKQIHRTNPESPVEQLWRYMNQFATPYGIVTNYKIFILFKHSAGSLKYYLFDFEEIKKNQNKLKEFVAIFSKESIDSEFVEKVYEKSIIEERDFTKEFYKLYHETRLMMIKEFKENSPEISEEGAIHFSQLFLNRLMFIFFAEDTGKLEKRTIENKILELLKNVNLFSSNSNNISNSIVSLFNDLDKGSDFPTKIFGFNGGLFKHPIPPKIYFRDFRDDRFFKGVRQHFKLNKELNLNQNEKAIFNKFKNKLNPLIKNILLMASFDFKSEVNVNILGHIFEQSVSDLEDLKDKKTSRRKKEGIFYTPEYITDYICRNTIIPYLSKNGADNINDLLKEYSDNLQELEDKFKSTKILDPACGSGAFLIKAVDVMLEIFKAIQEYKEGSGKYEAQRGLKRKSNIDGQSTLKKWDEQGEIREIIENNIYGVDINEESVEITKLSLFLKIATKNKKLIDLSEKIKQGNSLIDDEEVAEKLAFDWNKEFPEVMEKGGFDIVIGNPPYVDSENMTKYNKKERDYLSKKYKSTKGNWDLYIPFIEKAFNLINEKGNASMITPNKWLSMSYGNEIRSMTRDYLYGLSDYSKIKVFEDAGIFPIIFFINKKKNSKLNVKVFNGENNFSEKTIKKELFENFDNFGIFFSKSINFIIKLLEKNEPLGKVCNISGAFTTSEAYDLIPFLEDKDIDSKDYLKFINTGTIEPHFTLWGISLTKYIKKDYMNPVISKDKFKKNFKRRFERFDKPKIIISGIRHFESIYDKNNEYLAGKSTSVLIDLDKKYIYEYIISLLNSKLIKFYLKEGFSCSGMDGGINFSPAIVSTIPIPEIKESEQKQFIEKSDLMLKLNREFYDKKNKFLRLLKHEYNLKKLSKKLENFYVLEFDDLIKQLGIKELNMDKKSELLEFFDKNKKELLSLKEKINKIDNQIDEEIYKLYELSKAEQDIIEKS